MEKHQPKNLKTGSIWIISTVILLGSTFATPGWAQEDFPNCKGLLFSTEEDFVTQGPKPSDGNPIISDGDLLYRNIPGPGVGICARNRDLLKKFQVRVDLGLDAVDVIAANRITIAFSTELDDPRGQFTAGDLLTTDGAIIPNQALLALFQLPMKENLGLDAVQLIGREEAIIKAFTIIKEKGRDHWVENPKELVSVLEEYKVDIWFSTSGTGFSPSQPSFLDGDLLSARTGIIVAANSLLLPPSVPAGIPSRGVDFGLDAVTADRKGERESIHYSTEILYQGKPSFTDGDVLRIQNGIIFQHEQLVIPFEPRARFLGLDALHLIPAQVSQNPNIQTMCGDRAVADFDGGLVTIGGPGTGLYRANSASSPPGDNPRQPCGEYVPIDGFLPDSGIKRFRVAYRPAGDPFPGVNFANGIQTKWNLYEPHPIFAFCWAAGGTTLDTDTNGWMDATTYLTAMDGTLTGCANNGLRLAIWDTHNKMGLGPANKDGHYVVWLEWEDTGGIFHRESFEHHIQLDNTKPQIAAFPNGLQVKLMDGSTPVPACGEAPKGAHEFQVWGQFSDNYYWNFRLVLRGGLPPTTVSYGPHHYYDPDDGSGFKHTDDTGTIPDLTTVHLRNIDMMDLGRSFKDCCYVLDLYVRDAAIRHSFNKRVANDVSGSSAWQAHAFVTFAAAP